MMKMKKMKERRGSVLRWVLTERERFLEAGVFVGDLGRGGEGGLGGGRIF